MSLVSGPAGLSPSSPAVCWSLFTCYCWLTRLRTRTSSGRCMLLHVEGMLRPPTPSNESSEGRERYIAGRNSAGAAMRQLLKRLSTIFPIHRPVVKTGPQLEGALAQLNLTAARLLAALASSSLPEPTGTAALSPCQLHLLACILPGLSPPPPPPPPLLLLPPSPSGRPCGPCILQSAWADAHDGAFLARNLGCILPCLRALSRPVGSGDSKGGPCC